MNKGACTACAWINLEYTPVLLLKTRFHSPPGDFQCLCEILCATGDSSCSRGTFNTSFFPFFTTTRSFKFPGMSNYRALGAADGEEGSRDSSIESFRRSDDETASTRYLIVLTCSTAGYVAHQ